MNTIKAAILSTTLHCINLASKVSAQDNTSSYTQPLNLSEIDPSVYQKSALQIHNMTNLSSKGDMTTEELSDFSYFIAILLASIISTAIFLNIRNQLYCECRCNRSPSLNDEFNV